MSKPTKANLEDRIAKAKDGIRDLLRIYLGVKDREVRRIVDELIEILARIWGTEWRAKQ